MRTIRLATAYQLVLTSLLVGACLGTVGQRLPETFSIPVQSVQAKAMGEEQAVAPLSASSAQRQEQSAPLPTFLPPTVAEPQRAGGLHYPFILTEQRQHAEQVVPRLYLYVHNQDEGLGNFTVHVRKDGVLLPVDAKTYAGTPGYTWPTPHVRQHLTNLKVEFPDVPATGQWEIQLMDPTGSPVGPIATFTLEPNDHNKEMYVRYEVQ
ncbi:MAG: hypothetical protein KDE19_06480 [Caldilineaceae bacterium]|nr:hypothetical protein [Caldilineaceae bacterium]